MARHNDQRFAIQPPRMLRRPYPTAAGCARNQGEYMRERERLANGEKRNTSEENSRAQA